MRKGQIPELLAPAGTPDALYAAVAAGTDAVYFGTGAFNARMNAENFTGDALDDAITHCHRYGVKVYMTLNTQLYGREVEAAAETARDLWNRGADAFIVADLGLASVLHSRYPDMELHASTQMTGENVLSAEVLKKLGFTRMVAPRELSREDTAILCRNSPLETEVFIHGALCVCHSGQCLLSSVIGGRSGNRGECAQPCRLPYSCGKTEGYPLSLKDLCLAGHIREILEIGPASLKIEGRMKSADYVYGVVSVYRRLLDEGRDATEEEKKQLAGLFSRSGFTDGYYTGRITSDMLGVRTSEDKTASRAATGKTDYRFAKKMPLTLIASFDENGTAALTGSVVRRGETFTASVTESVPAGDYPALSEGRLTENLSKWGQTAYVPVSVTVTGAGAARMPISSVNAMRRALAAELDKVLCPQRAPLAKKTVPNRTPLFRNPVAASAFFASAKDATPEVCSHFDRVFVPLDSYLNMSVHPANMGFAFPPVCLDTELAECEKAVKKAVSMGCRTALISTLWQVPIADRCGLIKHGDIRLGACNDEALDFLSSLGFASVILSPEAGTPRVASSVQTGAVVYGRLPVMTLEKCVIREVCGEKLPPREACRYCRTHPFTLLRDRTGTTFPVCGDAKHRNVIYNSVPTYMADKKADLSVDFLHCIFTDEGGQTELVIERIERGEAPVGKFRRLQSPK